MKKILVPTDLSVPAEHAVDMAARLAAKHGAELLLLHSADVPATWQDSRFTSAVLATKPLRDQQALYPEARERVGKVRQALEETVMRLSKRKVNARYEIAPNAAWEDVIRIAKGHKVDLVVMGTRGAGALKEAFLGSNTQKVVRMAAMPVLTLHSAAPARIANVAVLVDPLDKDIHKVLAKLLSPLDGERVRFHLVNVNTPGRFQDTDTALEMLRNVGARMPQDVKVHTCDHFSVPEGGIAFARREGMDMIALPTHGRAGLQGFLNASVAETVVNHSPVPVITLRV
jgi:nucleotide-binding universal stress UspA family protein